MKIPEPKKLPSGNWRIQIQVNGKKYSITDKDKKVVKQKAKEVYAGSTIEKRVPMTVKEAMKSYISMNNGILSPSTLLGYKRYSENYLQLIMDTNISDLTQIDVQHAVNIDARRGISPKTIRNAHGFLSKVLKTYRRGFSLDTNLPEKTIHEAIIPEEDDMHKIWLACRGTQYELPILLGSWLGLRMSEVRGLKYTDVSNGKIHVQRALVRGIPKDENSSHKTETRLKSTKTYSGDRYIQLPKQIEDLINSQEHTSEYVCPYCESAIYKNYKKTCRLAGVTPTRFHDLRHFEASSAHSIGIPDAYQVKRLGHKTDHMLKTTYRHTLKKQEDQFANAIDEHMSTIFSETSHESSHEVLKL